MDNSGKQSIHRHSHQRDVILEELRAAPTHPTADELYQRVRQRLPQVSLATVYRNLELLAEEGQIQKLELSGQQRRFDGEAAGHTHIRCLNCGAVADVPVEPVQTPLEQVQGHTNYDVTGQRIEFLGRCPECCRSSRD